MRAEYDFDNNWVTQIEQDDGRTNSTNNPVIPGSHREWLACEVEYPEGYQARLAQLLTTNSPAYRFDADERKVIIYYPEADFTATRVRAYLIELANGYANRELQRSDWQVIRAMEIGEPISAELRAERQAIRDKWSDFTAEIAALPESDLAEFEMVPPGAVASTGHGAPAPDKKQGATQDDSEEARRPQITDAASPDQEGTPVRPAEAHEVTPDQAP